ncbi:nuclear transport factor 2 family protein [Chryseolinea sp. H1M3-3]|uniref:nuclear transport factor 2 family protein n=1 Tax=Chryseolinea sp. H1M3-3 TaxID=3034144 RepID=UPI0023ECE61A|nr:nuclear transport factor 2 family protein [Chryseolinea sp. H1M3-3]
MENTTIKQRVLDLFNGADERNWEKVKMAFAENVLLDYSSLSGNPASVQPSVQIIDAWKSFLPGFDRTHHQLSDFTIQDNDGHATATFKGKADHFIGNDSWTVEGRYHADLKNLHGSWFITMLKFELEKQSGNNQLPGMAVQNVREKK